jgi:AAA ATPase domain/Trypsin-like peptidase domain
MSGLDRERVVAILTPVLDGYNVGSGYLIDTTLVLTARHVVAGAKTCEVRRLTPDGYRFDLGAELQGEVLWRGSQHDAALVRIDEQRRFAPQDFGRIDGLERVPCLGVGFPRAQLKPGKSGKPQRRDTEELRGQIAPLTNLRLGALTVHIDGNVPERDANGRSPWEGISGAALFAGSVLVGVVTVHPSSFGTSRLEAVPVTALAEDAEFAEVFRRETGREFTVGNVVESALAMPAGVVVMNFLQQYLGDGDRAVPFAGRDSQLRDLDAWLEETSRANLLLTGLPGRGKSALLARWWQHLERDRDRIRTAFVPITIRYELNRETDVLTAVVARLAAAQERDLAPSSSPAELREQLGALLKSPPPEGRRTVLILDGLDEAADWRAWRSLLPLRPADRVKVLISARLTATHSTAPQWLEELGWDEGATAMLSVEKLSAAGTRAVIQSARPPLSGIARDAELVERLHAITDGDPLVLGLYLRHLRSAAVTDLAAAIRGLDSASAGLDGFIERWWEDQRALWGPNRGTREPAVRTTFNLLATALGPLERAGLLALVRREQEIDGDELREAIESLERIVIFEWPTSVALSHPRIGEHRLRQLRDDGELERYEDLFIGWGRETLDDLVAGRLEPSRAPIYTVFHYRGHLDRLYRQRGTSDELVTRYLELLAPPWLRAWEEAAEESAGYLEDVDAARRAAGGANRAAVARGGSVPFIAEEIRCAMVRAEQENSLALVQGELLGTLVAEGIWSGRRAVAACEEIEDPWPLAESLAAVIPHLSGRDLRRAAELLPALAETEEVYENAVARLARRLAETEGAVAARALADELESGRAAALLGLLPLAPADDRAGLVRSVWTELEESTGSELLERLTETVDLEFAREALGPHPLERLTELLRQAETWWPAQLELEELEGVERAYAMAYRGAWLDPSQAAAETAEVLGRIREDAKRFNIDEALEHLVPYLRADHRPAALAVVDELIDEDRRPAAWAILLDAGVEPGDLLRRALAGLADLEQIRPTSEGADFLAALARHGAAEACLDRVAELDEEDRDQTTYLIALAPQLDPGEVRRALTLVRASRAASGESAAQALLARLGSFGAAEAGEALELAATPEESAGAGSAIAALSQIGRPQLELSRLLPRDDDTSQQSALAICARSSEVSGEDLLRVVRSFETESDLRPGRPLEAGAIALFAELHPRLSDDEIVSEAALHAAELLIERGLHPRKPALIARYMRRLAAAAGAPAALALGKRLSTSGSRLPLALIWAIVGAAAACHGEEETAAFEQAAESIGHPVGRAAAEAALLALQPPGPRRDDRFAKLVRQLKPGDIELSTSNAALFFAALPDEYRAEALRLLIPDQLLTGKSRYALDATWAGQMVILVGVLEPDQVRRLHKAAPTIRQSGDRAKLLAATATRIGVFGHLDEAIDELSTISPEYLEPALTDLFESVPDAELGRLIEFASDRLGSPWYGARRAWIWVAASRRLEALAPARQLHLLQSWLDRDPSREAILVDLLLFAPSILRLGARAACEELSEQLECR